MNKIEHILRKNEMFEKEDFTIFPDSKFTILEEALIMYYETYQSSWVDGDKRSHFVIVNSSVGIRTSMSQNLILNQYSSLVFFQMFFELYFTDFLKQIHPAIIFANTINDSDISDYSEWDKYILSKGEKEKTIDFKRILIRFNRLIEMNSDLPSKYQVPLKFHYLRNHLDTIKTVINYRNSILHKGEGILNDFYFDWLWINYNLPLLYQVVNPEDKDAVILRTVYCELDIVAELIKKKLPNDYKFIDKNDVFVKKLNRICHLKALGRASYKNKLYVAKGFPAKAIEYIKNKNHKKIELENKKAQLFKQYLDFPEPFICPCCGCSTLIPSTKWVDKNNTQVYEKAKCTQCDYQVTRWNNEPKDFGIMAEAIFKCKKSQCQK